MERCRKYPHTMFSVLLSDMGKRHHLNRQRENRVLDNGDNPLSDSLFLVVRRRGKGEFLELTAEEEIRIDGD